MRFLVRIDDYPFALVNDRRVKYGDRIANLEKFHNLFVKHNVPYLLGVVPAHINNLDALSLQNLGSKGLLTVAMHGYDHHRLRAYYTEFGNRIAERMALLFEVGLDRLAGLGRNIYISPFNEYSAELFEALFGLGFSTFMGGEILEEAKQEKLLEKDGRVLTGIYPERRLYGTSDMVLGGIGSMPEDDLIHCLTLHWTWEINYMQMGIGSLEKLLDKISGKCLNYLKGE